MQDYDQIRTSLIDMLEDLNSGLQKIAPELPSDDAAIDGVELSEPVVENAEQVAQPICRSAQDIEKIKSALVWMDKGQFGVCQSCGDAITRQRLATMPFTSLCVKCANQVEGC